jgi:hypothetical protein
VDSVAVAPRLIKVPAVVAAVTQVVVVLEAVAHGAPVAVVVLTALQVRSRILLRQQLAMARFSSHILLAQP